MRESTFKGHSAFGNAKSGAFRGGGRSPFGKRMSTEDVSAVEKGNRRTAKGCMDGGTKTTFKGRSPFGK